MTPPTTNSPSSSCLFFFCVRFPGSSSFPSKQLYRLPGKHSCQSKKKKKTKLHTAQHLSNYSKGAMITPVSLWMRAKFVAKMLPVAGGARQVVPTIKCSAKVDEKVFLVLFYIFCKIMVALNYHTSMNALSTCRFFCPDAAHTGDYLWRAWVRNCGETGAHSVDNNHGSASFPSYFACF